jgi:hypothetical protein
MALAKEKKLFESELSYSKKIFYKEQEKVNLRNLFSLLFSMQSEDELKDIRLRTNPLIKIITLPFVFEHPEENKLRGPVYKPVILRATFFNTEELYISDYNLKNEAVFFKILYDYQGSFTFNLLIEKIRLLTDAKKSRELEEILFSYTKNLLCEQILVIQSN